MYLYTKDPYQAKYQFSIKIHDKVVLNHDDPRAFIE